MMLMYWKFLAFFVIFFAKPGRGQVCPNHMIQCGTEDRCETYTVKCDGVETCENDELDCDGNCGADEYRCDSGACIPSHMKCNRRQDCAGNDDEAGCTNSEGCHYGSFQCKPSMECRSYSGMCDFGVCPPGDEEPVCDGKCAPDEFACEDGACIPDIYQCDGWQHCAGWEDEKLCSGQCNSDEFVCEVGACVGKSLRCDGTPHCRDGNDEDGCDTIGQ
uniref:Very low-density lipoprotein receptor-like n=1 Tax=Phallusia mammillata TaxID=59560 RepID=A0A6F9DXB7_9ASCI|nr:very low-density lipoprotein receptor-like [Phallusia mammillata]